jgi:hypothetical protein
MADMAGSRRVDMPRFPAPRRRGDEQRSPYRERLAPNVEPPSSGVVTTGKVRLVVVRPDPPEQSRLAFLRQPFAAETSAPVSWLGWALRLPVLFLRQHPHVLWLLLVPVLGVPILTLWGLWCEQHHLMASFAG